jgi:hypothetical protein
MINIEYRWITRILVEKATAGFVGLWRHSMASEESSTADDLPESALTPLWTVFFE